MASEAYFCQRLGHVGMRAFFPVGCGQLTLLRRIKNQKLVSPLSLKCVFSGKELATAN